MKKICVVTGTRAEFGLLQWVIEGIDKSPSLTLQLVATGMHLSPEFGLTVDDIAERGFTVDRCVETLLSSDSSVGIAKSIGLGVIGFADAFADLKPDLLLVLGDRFEILAAATAAMAARIPIAHLHGGELTEGLIDDAIRHSITKMSHVHFVSTAEYRDRVIQLGEHPDRVFCVGALGVDSISRLDLMSKSEVEESLDFKFGSRNLMVCFHPTTLENKTSEAQFNNLLQALDKLEDTSFIFTKPNADMDGRIIFEQIDEFCGQRPHAKAFTSLGQLRYLSCIAHTDGVVGNSSSGLLEVPSFKKGTVNVGDRQRGRVRGDSVIDCGVDEASIRAALDRLFSAEFQSALAMTVNPYGGGEASQKVISKLEQISFEGLHKKEFFDLSGRQ